MIDANMMKAIETALKSGFRVELRLDRDGNVVAQTVHWKRLKTE